MPNVPLSPADLDAALLALAESCLDSIGQLERHIGTWPRGSCADLEEFIAAEEALLEAIRTLRRSLVPD